MKHKTKSSRTDELRREYTRSDFPNGFVRGKYAARIAPGSGALSKIGPGLLSKMSPGGLQDWARN